MIPTTIKIKNNKLPDGPGVYFYYDVTGKLLYIGKATSLKARVGSYFNKAHEARIEDLVRNIARIEYVETPSVIEALVLEANQIKLYQPPYNVMQRDDKSFLYLCMTNEDWPKPLLYRGFDLERMGIEPFSRTLSAAAKQKFLVVYGPYISGRSLRTALDLVRKTIPWSTCTPGQKKPCFDAQIGKCPGVCSGMITKIEYRKIIKQLMLFFSGKKDQLLRQLMKEMSRAASVKNFEEAARLRNRVFALDHIQDVSLITRSDDEDERKSWKTVRTARPFIDIDGRLEAYDIAHISGTAKAASMVVFVNGKPVRELYRKFKIKIAAGANDVADMEEVMRRRLARAISTPKTWGLPELMIIDGGEGQVARVQQVLDEVGVKVPIVGIAKGFAKKQDRLVYDAENKELQRVALTFKAKLAEVRDEAHRFAGAYHRILRSKNSFGKLVGKRNP
jgi:excinuclease ABC subunit C